MKPAKLRAGLTALSVYRGILNHPTIEALRALLFSTESDEDVRVESWGYFVSLLQQDNCDLSALCARLLMECDNIFARAAASGKQDDLPEATMAATKLDMRTIQRISLLTPDELLKYMELPGELSRLLPRWESRPLPKLLEGKPEDNLKSLAKFHRQNGFGIFVQNKAFRWRNGALHPIINPDPIDLAGLKQYKKQRKRVIENTEAFVSGLPANNVLLYGDRGTGKSSTVHALLPEYASRGLRIVEISKTDICEFPDLIDVLADIPLRFLIFIDDLSFTRGDDSYAELKAVLEGGISARPDNMLIYATTNRRHLVREQFSDRDGDELHQSDTIQELLSLSDRFGLMVTFTAPDRDEYYKILDEMAEDRKLKISAEELHEKAEQHALERGGRSPRIAKQFMDYVQTRLLMGKEI